MRIPVFPRAFLFLALASFAPTARAAAAPADAKTPAPVEGLRRVLATPPADPEDPQERAVRKENIEKAVEKLTFADLLPSLQLMEWQDGGRDENLSDLDRQARRKLEDRLIEECATRLAQDPIDRKLALLTLLRFQAGPMPSATGIPLGRRLAPAVSSALADDDPRIVAAAARTLGNLRPKAEEAVLALAKVLTHKDATIRRAAVAGLADALRDLEKGLKSRDLEGIREGAVRARRVRPGPPVEWPEKAEVPVWLEGSLAAARTGLTDTDAAVRRESLEIVRRATATTQLLGELSPAAPEFPPPERKPTEEEAQLIEKYREAVATHLDGLRPQLESLRKTVPAVVVCLKDEDTGVKLVVCQVMEEVSALRRRLERLRRSVPGAKEPSAKLPPEDLLTGLRDGLSGLAALVADKDVEVRLAALYALEEFDADAVAAVDAVAKAMNDADPFVRWGAARVLVRLAPREPAVVIPGLVRGLTDPNGDVRLTAAVALKNYGPAAELAVPELIKAVNRGDPDSRVIVIQALAAVGKAAEPATPALIEALANPSARVRGEAVRTLAGFMGVPKVTEAIRKALDDTDPEVRKAAADALLRLDKE